MKLLKERVRGMQDLLPDKSWKWEHVEFVMKSCAKVCGFEYIRTPVLEFTELFERSVGSESDIVKKEMYTFKDKSNRSVTMRPEWTAGVLRAVIDYVDSSALPLKVMYSGPCYRYERPQSGRYREFFQFGVEIFGASSILADFELIFLANLIIEKLGILNCNLHINFIGCKNCRSLYNDSILKYFERFSNILCETCCERLSKNTLRIFDCKNSVCKDVCVDAPKTIDHICENCYNELEDFKVLLNNNKIKYFINPMVVRGLDYYTKVVFEFITKHGDSEITVCGGGRYDGLAKAIGGKELFATGFGMGIERIVSLVDFDNIFKEKYILGLYIAIADRSANTLAMDIASALRKNNIKVVVELMERSVKSQLRYCDKISILYSTVIGSKEVNSKIINVKKMSNGESFELNLKNDFTSFFKNL